MRTIGSLFTGIGGLELGLESCGLGPVLWQCDSDPAARAVLEEHWPGVKRYEDVRSIDAKVEPVDLICGGFPCQPVSVAGKRKAQRDTRWLWPFFAAAIARVRPRFVFIENVPGLRGAGLRDVLADLAALGFDAEWDTFSAEEVGAPHRRQRLFVLAHARGRELRHEPRRRRREGRTGEAELATDGVARDVAHAHGVAGFQSRSFSPAPVGDGRQRARPAAGGGGELVADAAGVAIDVSATARRRVPDAARDGIGGILADADGPGLEERCLESSRGEREAAQRGGSPADPWPAEPDVGRVAHGVPARVDRLRLLGNACVPAQAALAWRTLMSRASQEVR